MLSIDSQCVAGNIVTQEEVTFLKKKKKAIDETVSRDEISKLLMNFKQVTYKYYLHFYDFFNTERCIDYKRNVLHDYFHITENYSTECITHVLYFFKHSQNVRTIHDDHSYKQVRIYYYIHVYTSLIQGICKLIDIYL